MSCSNLRVPSRWVLTASMASALCMISMAAVAQSCYNNTNPNLLKNGDFEQGMTGYVIPDWHVAWPSYVDGVPVDPNVSVENDNPRSGAQELRLGTYRAANDITQEAHGTVKGKTYTVCFWLAASPSLLGSRTTFDVLWDDVNVLELTDSGTSPYQYYSLNVGAAGTDVLRFRERNDNGYYYLDDVAVQLCTGCGLAAQRSGASFRKPLAPGAAR